MSSTEQTLDDLLHQQAFPLWHWMTERHAIWERRQRNMPAPWTDDPVLAAWAFCNVYRELDRVTIWIRDNWREPYEDHPNLWFALAVARFFNWPETLDEIGFPKEDLDEVDWWEQAYTKLSERFYRGDKVFTGAYIITGGVGELGAPKFKKVLFDILLPTWQGLGKGGAASLQAPGTLQGAWGVLARYPGFGGGGFMAYEVITDLRHTPILRDSTDIQTWANPGPGARRGLERLLGRPVTGRMAMPEAVLLIRRLTALANKHGVPGHLGACFEARDIEHSLCETDKYLRVLLGEGTPRSRYHHR